MVVKREKSLRQIGDIGPVTAECQDDTSENVRYDEKSWVSLSMPLNIVMRLAYSPPRSTKALQTIHSFIPNIQLVTFSSAGRSPLRLPSQRPSSTAKSHEDGPLFKYSSRNPPHASSTRPTR